MGTRGRKRNRRTKPISEQGARLRKARETAALTRNAVAVAMSVDPSTIQRWEYGDLQPRADQLADLARRYGTTVAALMGEAPDAALATGTEG